MPEPKFIYADQVVHTKTKRRFVVVGTPTHHQMMVGGGKLVPCYSFSPSDTRESSLSYVIHPQFHCSQEEFEASYRRST